MRRLEFYDSWERIPEDAIRQLRVFLVSVGLHQTAPEGGAVMTSPKCQSDPAFNLFLREVLEQMPLDEQARLADAVREGKNIVLFIGQSAYGATRKVAFGWAITEDQSWRGLPETVGGVQ